MLSGKLVNKKTISTIILFLLLPLTLLLLASSVQANTIPLTISPPLEVDAFPVSGGIPFPPEALFSTDNVKVVNSKGEEILSQADPLVYWPNDKGIRVLLLSFIAKKGESYTLEYGQGVNKSPIPSPLNVEENNESITIETGKIKLLISKTKFNVIEGVWVKENGTYKQITGPGEIRVVNHEGKEFLASLGDTTQYQVKIEKRGPVMAQIRMEGGHFSSDNKKLFNSIVWLWAYAGSDKINLFHTLVEKEPTPAELPIREGWIDKMYGCALEKIMYGETRAPKVIPGKTKICHALQGWEITFPVIPSMEKWGDEVGDWLDEAENNVSWRPTTNEVFIWQRGNLWKEWAERETGPIGNPNVEMQRGQYNYPLGAYISHAAGWAGLTGQNESIVSAIRYFWQQYPKELSYDSQKLHLGLCSLRSGEPEFISTWAGVAKSHEIWLAFSNKELPEQDAQKIGQMFLKKPHLKVSPAWIRQSQLLEDWFSESGPYSKQFDQWMDQGWETNSINGKILAEADGSYTSQITYRGIKNFGDYIMRDGDCGFDGFSHDSQGENALIYYLRTGDERWYEDGEPMAWHFMDVDVQHSPGPWGRSGIPIPGAYCNENGIFDHQGTATHLDSHELMQGLPIYYLLTGNPRALEVIRERGDFMSNMHTWNKGWFERFVKKGYLDAMNPWDDLGRCIGNFADSIIKCYEATGDKKYLDRAWEIMEGLVKLWKTPREAITLGEPTGVVFKPPHGLFSFGYKVSLDAKGDTVLNRKGKLTRGLFSKYWWRLMQAVIEFGYWNKFYNYTDPQEYQDMIKQNEEWYVQFLWNGERQLFDADDVGGIYGINIKAHRHDKGTGVALFPVAYVGWKEGKSDYIEKVILTLKKHESWYKRMANTLGGFGIRRGFGTCRWYSTSIIRTYCVLDRIALEDKVSILTSSLPNGEVNEPYSYSLTATGGTPPYTWSIASGSLPAGLTLSSTGVISGTPTTAGTSTFTVKVTDSSDPPKEDKKGFTLTIAPAVSYSVSGGAYFYPESGRYRASFSVDVDSGNLPSSWLKYYYTKTRMYVVSSGINDVSVSDNIAHISGLCKVNGEAGYTFNANIVDNAPDAFGINIYKNAELYYSVDTMNISGGDISIEGK